MRIGLKLPRPKFCFEENSESNLSNFKIKISTTKIFKLYVNYLDELEIKSCYGNKNRQLTNTSRTVNGSIFFNPKILDKASYFYYFNECF